MRLINLNIFIFIAFLWFGSLVDVSNSFAVDNDAFNNSGLKVPRFVSLSKDKTNVRSGPGKQYPIKWVVIRRSLPVEIILERENWRKIKDHEGQEGWVFRTLLSGKRTAIISGDSNAKIYEKPSGNNDNKSRILVELEPSVNVSVDRCFEAWCNVNVFGFSGWIERKSLWGVYEQENFN